MDIDSLPPFLVTALVSGLVLASLASLAGFAYLCIGIWDKLKSKPTMQEALKDVPTKDDLRQTEDRLRADIDEVDTRCTEEIRRMRSYNSKVTGELFDLMRGQNQKFEEVIRSQGERFTESLTLQSKSTNRELNDLSKEVGKLSGLLESQQNKP